MAEAPNFKVMVPVEYFVGDEVMVDQGTDIIVFSVDPITHQTTEFFLHRNTLSAASPVWERAITFNGNNARLELSGYTFNTMCFLFAYAYTGTADFSSLSQCMEILVAADYYCMQNLIDACLSYIEMHYTNMHHWHPEFLIIYNTAIQDAQIYQLMFRMQDR